MQLEGKIAVVTGGGKGIGRGIVDRFIEEGAWTAIVQRRDLDPELLDHPKVVSLHADLSDPSSVPNVIESAVNQLGGIDILVNNAGVMFERSVSEITVEEWDMMIALNLRAPLFLTQAVLPFMRQGGGGSIINIGSIEGLGANPDHAAYCASKAGVHGLTRALAVDLGRDNIRCNAIAPGWISSELSETYLESMPAPAAAREALNRLHPVGRPGQSTEVGDLAVFLASDRSSFITGETIVIDGGRTTQLSQPY